MPDAKITPTFANLLGKQSEWDCSSMKTIAPQIHAAHYQQLRAIIQAIAQNQLEEAKTLTEAAIGQLPSTVISPDDIQALFFLNAVRHRLNPQASELGNLYLTPDQGQQIKMFNLMAEKFPLVRFSQDRVNAAHLAHMQGEQEILLVDIGIGSGQQMVRLLKQLGTLKTTPPTITLIGIEPAPESLTVAQQAVQQTAQAHGIPLQFTGIAKTLESLTAEDWNTLDDIMARRRGKCLINASFALHHINPPAYRAELFARLYGYQPALFALIEPYADFLTPDLAERFDNAWHHYGLTFGAIDQIDASVEEKKLVKTVFFSREIQDVLAEEPQRIERFETGEMWATRLTEAGFRPALLTQLPHHIPGCGFVSVHAHSGHVSLNVASHPLVSIITAHPA